MFSTPTVISYNASEHQISLGQCVSHFLFSNNEIKYNRIMGLFMRASGLHSITYKWYEFILLKIKVVCSIENRFYTSLDFDVKMHIDGIRR